MRSVHAPFEGIRRTLDSQLDDFRERRAAAVSEESRQEPPSRRSETTSAENDTDGIVRAGPYLRSASEPTKPGPPTMPSPPPDASTDPYLRNSWLARASE